jgi:hypothetical protein
MIIDASKDTNDNQNQTKIFLIALRRFHRTPYGRENKITIKIPQETGEAWAFDLVAQETLDTTYNNSHTIEKLKSNRRPWANWFRQHKNQARRNQSRELEQRSARYQQRRWTQQKSHVGARPTTNQACWAAQNWDATWHWIGLSQARKAEQKNEAERLRGIAERAEKKNRAKTRPALYQENWRWRESGTRPTTDSRSGSGRKGPKAPKARPAAAKTAWDRNPEQREQERKILSADTESRSQPSRRKCEQELTTETKTQCTKTEESNSGPEESTSSDPERN